MVLDRIRKKVLKNCARDEGEPLHFRASEPPDCAEKAGPPDGGSHSGLLYTVISAAHACKKKGQEK